MNMTLFIHFTVEPLGSVSVVLFFCLLMSYNSNKLGSFSAIETGKADMVPVFKEFAI